MDGRPPTGREAGRGQNPAYRPAPPLQAADLRKRVQGNDVVPKECPRFLVADPLPPLAQSSGPDAKTGSRMAMTFAIWSSRFSSLRFSTPSFLRHADHL